MKRKMIGAFVALIALAAFSAIAVAATLVYDGDLDSSSAVTSDLTGDIFTPNFGGPISGDSAPRKAIQSTSKYIV